MEASAEIAERPRPPLAGVRVLETCSWVSGPYAGLVLADLGAEVVKVEPPTGDPMRRFRRPATAYSAEFANCNRGKRSVALDLKAPEGRDQFLDLARTSDVVVSNWRPQVAESLGLGDATLVARNPRLIRVYITGFGPTGPLARAAAFDSVVQARSGMTMAAGSAAPSLAQGYPVDKLTGLVAAQAALAALFARERDGRGDRVDVPMLDVAAYVDFVELFANRTFLDTAPAEAVNVQATALRPLPARDGWIVLAPVAGVQIRAVCDAVGHPEWLDELRRAPTAAAAARSLFDRLEAELPSRSLDDWLARFELHDVPVSPCLSLDQHLADEQVRHQQLYSVVDWPAVGAARCVRYPGSFQGRGRLVADRPPPEIGELDPQGPGTR